MSLKEKMEKVWATNKVACPSHLCRWNAEGRGWSFGFSVFLGYTDYLWFLPGKQTFSSSCLLKTKTERLHYWVTKRNLTHQFGTCRKRPW